VAQELGNISPQGSPTVRQPYALWIEPTQAHIDSKL